MTGERHKEVIDELKVLTDRKKQIAERIIKGVDWRVILSGNIERRTAMRKMLIAKFIKETDGLFTETSRLGKEFAEEKIREFNAEP